MQVIPSNVAFVSVGASVRTAVALMAARNISSVLVLNAAEKVCGIVTERDIVQRFALLGATSQASCTVEELMSKPVRFARQDHLVEDVISLHFAHRIRHFPVVREVAQETRQTVLGIVSITDVARNYLHSLAVKNAAPAGKAEKVTLHVLAYTDDTFSGYQGIFAALGYDVRRLESALGVPLLAKVAGKMALLVDMDGYPLYQLEPLLAAVRDTKLPTIFATSREELLEPFQKSLAGSHRDIALKPIDVSHCHWALINWLR